MSAPLVPKKSEAPRPGALGRASLARLLQAPQALVERLRNPEGQLQANGIDLTIETLWQLVGDGSIGGPAPGRRLPERAVLRPSPDGWYQLEAGAYGVALHEVVRVPFDLMALARPRSTLLRCGAQIHTAVFDAGYHGQPEALLVVANPSGLRLAADAAICQLVFFSLTEPVEGYQGAYQEKFFTSSPGRDASSPARWA